jgi:hypothetical protein
VSQPILMITALTGAEDCAAAMKRQLQTTVEIAANRKAALVALRRCEYSVVVVDDSLAEADPAGTDLIWKNAALAVPLQINFAISGTPRVIREVRAALYRREQEQALAMRVAASTIENELKSTVTGLLLQSQLALAEPSVSPVIAQKLKLVVELAGNLRAQLARPQA